MGGHMVQQVIPECTFPEFWQISYQFEGTSHPFENKSQQILNFYQLSYLFWDLAHGPTNCE